MEKLAHFGRFLFAISMAAFGAGYLIHASSTAIRLPGPPWVPGHRLLACFLGAALIAGAICIAAKVQLPAVSALLGILLLLCALVPYLPKLLAHPRNPNPWTSAFELLGLCGAAWVLSGVRTVGIPGRFLFAISLVVFGVQHFLYAHFVATLITPWIPGHLFWAYFVGVLFFAAALSILANRFAQLATILLGLMFLLWVFVLHLPRVLHALHNGNEWTSMFIALAMSGGSFILAGTST